MDPNANNDPVVAEPVAPVVDANDIGAATGDEADGGQAEAESKEWDDAAQELFPGLKSGKKKEGDKDEPAKPTEGDEKKPADKKIVEKDAAGKDKAESTEGDEEEVPDGDEPPDTTARDNRLAQRQVQQEMDTIKSDIRTKMFADVPTEMKDKDGDPIRSLEDVMRLINPRTGEAFTEEEAGMWFLSAQQQFNQTLAAVDKQIEAIAEVNYDLKDQADVVKYNYGELLKAMPELRDELWADYEATLIKDPQTGIIVRAPINLQRFYERSLKPYADKAIQLEEADTTTDETTTDTTTVAPSPEELKAQKAKKRADRADIYGGGKNDDVDPEDKEWGEAAEAVFGPRNGGKK